MDFLTFLESLQDNTEVFNIADVIFVIILSFILTLAIAWIYQTTYKGVSYTQSFVHTLDYDEPDCVYHHVGYWF